MEILQLIIVIMGISAGFFVQSVAGFAGGIFSGMFSIGGGPTYVMYIYNKINEKHFNKILMILLGFSGIALIIR